MSFTPFKDGDTLATFRNLIDKVIGEIKSLENEYVLKASPSELEEYYIDKVLIEPLVLHADQYYIENQSQTSIDVSHDYRRAVFPGERAIVNGTKLDIAIPFSGTESLWRICPSTRYMCHYPDIDVFQDHILLTFCFPDDSANPESLKNRIKEQVKLLSDMIGYLKKDIDNHNKIAPQAVRTALKRKVELAKSVVSTVSDLGIPIRKRNEPLTYTIPTKRRKPPIERPKVSTEPYKPEPSINEYEYLHILNVLRGMSLVIERNPHDFASLNEESIRTHFLLQLNGHYEGAATGETFNASGKTDILIRVEDKNVFIAECKFWKGPKSLNNAIDQLLSYLSWRDTKCALLIFNKTKDTSSVRAKMHETMEGREEHKKTVTYDPDGDCRYVFIKKSDPGREIIITTQLYDIPNKKTD